jgi:hypothetical protein
LVLVVVVVVAAAAAAAAAVVVVVVVVVLVVVVVVVVVVGLVVIFVLVGALTLTPNLKLAVLWMKSQNSHSSDDTFANKRTKGGYHLKIFETG